MQDFRASLAADRSNHAEFERLTDVWNIAQGSLARVEMASDPVSVPRVVVTRRNACPAGGRRGCRIGCSTFRCKAE